MRTVGPFNRSSRFGYLFHRVTRRRLRLVRLYVTILGSSFVSQFGGRFLPLFLCLSLHTGRPAKRRRQGTRNIHCTHAKLNEMWNKWKWFGSQVRPFLWTNHVPPKLLAGWAPSGPPFCCSDCGSSVLWRPRRLRRMAMMWVEQQIRRRADVSAERLSRFSSTKTCAADGGKFKAYLKGGY